MIGISTFSRNYYLKIFSKLNSFSKLKFFKVRVRFYSGMYPNAYYCLSTQWALGKCFSMDWTNEKWSKDNNVVKPWDGSYGQSKVHHYGFLQLPQSERGRLASADMNQTQTLERTLHWAWLTCIILLPVKLMWSLIASLTLMDISRKKWLSLCFWTDQPCNNTEGQCQMKSGKRGPLWSGLPYGYGTCIVTPKDPNVILKFLIIFKHRALHFHFALGGSHKLCSSSFRRDLQPCHIRNNWRT